jgi:hypothetical protein
MLRCMLSIKTVVFPMEEIRQIFKACLARQQCTAYARRANPLIGCSLQASRWSHAVQTRFLCLVILTRYGTSDTPSGHLPRYTMLRRGLGHGCLHVMAEGAVHLTWHSGKLQWRLVCMQVKARIRLWRRPLMSEPACMRTKRTDRISGGPQNALCGF